MEGVLFYSWVNEKVRVLEGGEGQTGWRGCCSTAG